jgi:hypothetical protein
MVLSRGFSLSRWLAGDGFGSVTAPRGHSLGHSGTQRQGLTIAAVSMSEVRAEHSASFSHPVALHVLSFHFPCSIGHVAPSSYYSFAMLPIPFCSHFDEADVRSLPAAPGCQHKQQGMNADCISQRHSGSPLRADD